LLIPSLLIGREVLLPKTQFTFHREDEEMQSTISHGRILSFLGTFNVRYSGVHCFHLLAALSHSTPCDQSHLSTFCRFVREFSLRHSDDTVEQRLTDNLHSQFRPIVRPCRNVLDLAQCEHPIYNLTEDNVLLIQEVTRSCSYEELEKPTCEISGVQKYNTSEEVTDLAAVGVWT